MLSTYIEAKGIITKQISYGYSEGENRKQHLRNCGSVFNGDAYKSISYGVLGTEG